MALALLPASAFAASDIPDGYVPIYTLADLKENIGSDYYLLMNDIDASAENIAYDTLNNAACGTLPKSLLRCDSLSSHPASCARRHMCARAKR